MIVWSLVVILFLIAADQLTKMLVVAYVKPAGMVPLIDHLLEFVYIENRGAAFGILQNQKWIFIVMTVISCMILLYILFFYKNHSFLSKIACILIIAGGIGNLIDRIKLSYVIDFISVSFFPPVFNFADCCVVVGVVFAIFYLLKTELCSIKNKDSESLHEQNDSDSCPGK